MRRFVFACLAIYLAITTATGSAIAQASYSPKPGDVLNIEVLEDPGLNRQVLVLPDGTISFPIAGSVMASGRTLGEIQQALVAGLTPNFAAPPNVYTSVQSLAAPRPSGSSSGSSAPAAPASQDVYIMGEIAKPGKHAVGSGTTILQLLASAGGLTNFAAEKRIELHRVDPKTNETKIYLFSYSGKGGGERIPGSTALMAGDVIIVPQRKLFE